MCTASSSRDSLGESSGKWALRIGMGCKAQSTAIAGAMASICNAADRPSPQMPTARGFVQRIPCASPAPGDRRACACHAVNCPNNSSPLGLLAASAEGFLDALRAISKALRAEMRDKPDEAKRLSTLYAQIGMLAPRLEELHATAQLLLQDAPEGAVPAAKWFTLEVDGDFIVVKAHASPILPGTTLRNHLWSAVRGAVLTSATLTSCGHFDFFLREAGLHGDEATTTLEVPSPSTTPRRAR